MKLKLFITHTLVALIFTLLTISYYTLKVLPSMVNYIPSLDVQEIYLPGDKELHPYSDIVELSFVANLYRLYPLFFFKRDDAYNMERELAQKGYANSIRRLTDHHLIEATNPKNSPEEQAEHKNKAIKWAFKAPEYGFYLPLFDILEELSFNNDEETSRALNLLDAQVKAAPIGEPSLRLAQYYEAHENVDKAKFYKNLAQEIDADDERDVPQCFAIAPWKDW